MKYLFVAMLLALSGCSSMTVHEYCQANGERYKDYDQCYAEASANKENIPKSRRAAGAFFQGFGQGVQNSQRNRINCTTTDFGSGITKTNCQ